MRSLEELDRSYEKLDRGTKVKSTDGMFIDVFLFTKSKSETQTRKHIHRSAFEFLILSTKIKAKGLQKSYSPENHHKMSNFTQRKPPKVLGFATKIQ